MQEPILAGVCQLHACLLRGCICLGEVVPHLDPWLRRRVLLDGSLCVYRNSRADVALSSLRRMVFGDLVVQPKFLSEAMRSLWLTKV